MKTLKRSTLNKGSTLVELLLYMGMLVIFISILGSLFSTSIDMRNESNATSSIDLDGNFVFSRLAYDVHRADSIVTPALAGSSSASLTVSIGGTNYTYAVDGDSNLVLTAGANSYVINSYGTNVSAFSVTRIGDADLSEDSVRINLTLSSLYVLHKGTESKTMQTTIGIR